ncbi:MAG: hypothetical protein ACLFPJ_05960 [Candidatus Woesearchaeota archaeon]
MLFSMSKQKKSILIMILIISLLSGISSFIGIFSGDGTGEFEYTSIRGDDVKIYGTGIYKHMSSDVAIQGIAHDYVTLFIAIPLLLVALFFFIKNNLKGHIALLGILFYFFVTYLFYIVMAMYNELFLVYVVILCLVFFSFIIILFNKPINKLIHNFKHKKLIRIGGYFLIINSIMVAFLWLSIIIPPLISGLIYPKELQHYTTLIVQGLDLALLLPIGIVSGFLAIKKDKYGYLFTSIYLIFLSILMAALSSKIIFMAKEGINVIPVIFIMPTICLISLFFSIAIIKNINSKLT